MNTKAQSNLAPVVITATTLPEAYALIVAHIASHPGNTISPLSLTISNTNATELIGNDKTVKNSLDTVLHARDDLDIETVAFTIFPERYHRIADDRADFFDIYKDVFPRLQALDQRNKRGLYFQRLTMWGSGPCDGNQLEWIIQQYNKRTGVRASMFQASIFDPSKDHTASALIGFPCLQHISFVPKNGELVMNAFYATQTLLRKAYGNYLGLLRLGGFMANEMNLEFTRLNVFVGVAKLDEIGKTTAEFEPVLESAKYLLDNNYPPSAIALATT